MRRRLFVAVLLSSAVALSPAMSSAAQTAQAAPAFAYPKAKTVDVVETQFGVPVADPYRWLENDVRNDTEVANWVAEENKVTDAFLQTLPLRNFFKQRMTALYDYER